MDILATILVYYGNSSSATTNELSVCKTTTRAECLGLFLLEGYNRHPFGRRIEELEDDFFKGQDDHPDNFTGSYNLLVNYQNMRFAQTDVGNELVFLSNGKKELKIFNMPQMLKDVTCHKCKKKGNYTNKCPNLKKRTNLSTTPILKLLHSSYKLQKTKIPEVIFSDFSFIILNHIVNVLTVHSSGNNIPNPLYLDHTR